MRTVCAYCGNTNALTKEHLWPAALHTRMQKIWESPGHNLFWLSRLDRDIPSEPTIKDVCSNCNNVILSKLDTYICDLFDKYFFRNINKGEKVCFKYDYDLLVRWLLKLSYNSCRINDGIDHFVFQPLLPYILGYNQKYAESVCVFLELSYPARIPVEDSSENLPAGTLVWPDVNRSGHLIFRCRFGKKIFRAVHLCGFTFTLAFFEPSAHVAIRAITTAEYLHARPKAILLRPERQKVYVKCGGINAYESLKNSRSFTFYKHDLQGIDCSLHREKPLQEAA